MKQKLYDLDAFFIEKLKLSENDPFSRLYALANLRENKALANNKCFTVP